MPGSLRAAHPIDDEGERAAALEVLVDLLDEVAGDPPDHDTSGLQLERSLQRSAHTVGSHQALHSAPRDLLAFSAETLPHLPGPVEATADLAVVVDPADLNQQLSIALRPRQRRTLGLLAHPICAVPSREPPYRVAQ